jgi:hypothetical protein
LTSGPVRAGKRAAVDLRIEPGETVALAGSTGSGHPPWSAAAAHPLAVHLADVSMKAGSCYPALLRREAARNLDAVPRIPASHS